MEILGVSGSLLRGNQQSGLCGHHKCPSAKRPLPNLCSVGGFRGNPLYSSTRTPLTQQFPNVFRFLRRRPYLLRRPDANESPRGRFKAATAVAAATSIEDCLGLKPERARAPFGIAEFSCDQDPSLETPGRAGDSPAPTGNQCTAARYI
jgi:hypothetical protein